jgi:hypothetical protein
VGHGRIVRQRNSAGRSAAGRCDRVVADAVSHGKPAPVPCGREDLVSVLWGSQSWLQPAFSRLSSLPDASVFRRQGPAHSSRQVHFEVCAKCGAVCQVKLSSCFAGARRDVGRVLESHGRSPPLRHCPVLPQIFYPRFSTP